MKKRAALSPAQLRLLVWAGLMAPVTDALPRLLLDGAGRNAWISVLLGGLMILLLAWLLRDSPLPRLGASFPGKVFLTIYMVWMEGLLALRLGSCARRLLASEGRDGSGPFFLLVAALLLLRLNSGSLSAFARAGQLFFAALALMAGAVLLLSLPTARFERLLPVEMPALSPALLAAGVLGWGVIPAAFLPVDRERTGSRVRWGLVGCILLTASQMILLANLGPGLAARVPSPFFALAKGAGIEGAFQRIEGVVSALWLFSDLTMGGLLVFAQRRILSVLCGEGQEPWKGGALIALAALAGWLLLPGIESIDGVWVAVGNLVLTGLLALTAWVGLDRERKKQGKHSLRSQ